MFPRFLSPVSPIESSPAPPPIPPHALPPANLEAWTNAAEDDDEYGVIEDELDRIGAGWAAGGRVRGGGATGAVRATTGERRGYSIGVREPEGLA